MQSDDPFLQALLAELRMLLAQLLESGESGQIDLLRLPMAPAQTEALRALLGQGEIVITLEAEGPSRIEETRLSGVWWVEHHDRAGHLVARLLEVAAVPEIVPAAAPDIGASLGVLSGEDAGKAET
ncbi:hydrogenase expression/formation protein [Pseudooceanicola sp. CBS1P-1]|uniref:Hydrogenase expression/formation protein n=1 Tax=Pseudooceanicola albus TaxID=2692189 RepID=A0A6L7GAB2_9RHOB|nr:MULTISPECIES: hydrogenase expression/formation protein [Pseudooceanicola]MBT9386266.1 hydrogenase expression/formation protein [Pseudooceanicola endophyticus]MXN20316.1 hydrogenase expression/formation protein [Pseudooceanicola albus]